MAASPKSEARPRPRPKSPHLQVYRWPVTMLTSILHRMSGVVNAAGALLVTVWLAAAAYGKDAHALISEVLVSPLGRLILFAFTLSLVYHLLNGLRHLIWDSGAGFGLKTARNSGLSVLVLTVILTLIVWVSGYWMGGAFQP